MEGLLHGEQIYLDISSTQPSFASVGISLIMFNLSVICLSFLNGAEPFVKFLILIVESLKKIIFTQLGL